MTEKIQNNQIFDFDRKWKFRNVGIPGMRKFQNSEISKFGESGTSELRKFKMQDFHQRVSTKNYEISEADRDGQSSEEHLPQQVAISLGSARIGGAQNS